MNEKRDNIYIYLWEELNTIYIGRTVNPKSRHYQHRHIPTEKTYKFSSEHGVEHPKMIIIENNLTAEEGIEREKYWINFYKENNHYTILNKTCGGQIGRLSIFTEEEKKEKYSTSKRKRNEYMKEYRKKNKTKIKELNKKYRDAHKEEIKELNKKYRDAYKEEITNKKRKYRETHKEEIRKKRKEYYEKNKTRIIEKQKKYASEHKEEKKIYDKVYRKKRIY